MKLYSIQKYIASQCIIFSNSLAGLSHWTNMLGSSFAIEVQVSHQDHLDFWAPGFTPAGNRTSASQFRMQYIRHIISSYKAKTYISLRISMNGLLLTFKGCSNLVKLCIICI